MYQDKIDVNSELYFNEKLNLWLNQLTSADVKLVLHRCFEIPSQYMNGETVICPWDKSDYLHPDFGRFDQKIDFGKDLCVIFELKVSTEATVGQIDKYLSYIKAAGYKNGYVILMTRNELASQKLGYDQLIKKNPNLLFFTWKQFESSLEPVKGVLQSTKSHTQTFLELISFLTDIRKRSVRLVDQPPPPSLDIRRHLSSLVKAAAPKKKGNFLAWRNRDEFWEELIEAVTSHSGMKSFCAFRFDFYEYIMRWAFHKKRVYLDIYEDKNYEYFYNYFISNTYPEKGNLPSEQYSDLYYRFLLIRKEEVLVTSKHSIFFLKDGKKWYIYIVNKNSVSNAVPYLQLFNLKFI